MIDFVFKMIDFVFKMMNFVFKMMNFADIPPDGTGTKGARDFALNPMNFALK